VSSGSNNIEIGTQGTGSDSGVIRIGGDTIFGDPVTQSQFFVAGVATANVSGAQVLVTSSGQLGVAQSSRRYKEDIQDMADASSGLMRLRPVTFRYKRAIDDDSKPIQYELIAEEVAEVYPDLLARSADGQIETVKYQVLDWMLLNELQMQQERIRGLEQQISEERQLNQTLLQRLTRLEAAMSSARP
jgi:hypothetical protein